MSDLVESNIISDIDKEVRETISSCAELIPSLIAIDQPLTALQTLRYFDYQILKHWEHLTSIYTFLYDDYDILEVLNSNVVKIFKENGASRGFLGRARLHKTFGMYHFGDADTLPKSESQLTLYKKGKKILGRDLEENEYISYSNVPIIAFMEIQLLVHILKNVVEQDWPPDQEEDIKEGERPNRHISQKVKISVWRRDQGKCVECGSKEKIEYDHIIPVSKGGSNTERNIQLLCEKCNRQKSANI